MSLTYLNVQSFYSSAGGPYSPEEWCRHARELGYAQIGIADRAPLAALPALLKASHEEKLTPIAGLEFDLLTRSDTGDNGAAQSVVLLPVAREGFSNLAALARAAYSRWPEIEKSIDSRMLTQHSEGLALILSDPAQLGEESLSEIKAAFGERLYAGFPYSGGENNGAECEHLAEAAARAGLPIVAMPSARYLRPEDKPSYEALRRARARAGWATSATACADGAFMRAPDEVTAFFSKWPQAEANNEILTEMCTAALAPGSFPDALRIDSRGTLEPGEPAKPWASAVASAVQTLVASAEQAGIPLGALLKYGEGQAAGYSGIEIPAGRRDALIRAIEDEHSAYALAFSASVLEITPAMALTAARDVLPTESESLEEMAGDIRTGGWEAIRGAAQDTGQEAEVARLALSLKGAPIALHADTCTVAFLENNSPGLPVLDHAGGPPALWVPWTGDTLCELGYPVLRFQPTRALSVLDAGLDLARRFPTPESETLAGDSLQAPQISEPVAAMLKKGELAGMPYLSIKALKGWKGDIDMDALAALVTLSCYPGQRPEGPEGVEAWSEHTAGTGGLLLFLDQFVSIVASVGKFDPGEAAALRAAMLNPSLDADGALRARFMDGCLQSGLEAETATRLYSALSASVPSLVSRDTASAHARIALSILELKAAHPAAFVAAWLGTAWERGGREAATPVIDEARRHGIALLPPDARQSGVGPTPSKSESQDWAVRWGLAQLPDWTPAVARRFTSARDTHDRDSLGDLMLSANEAGLSPAEIATLVQCGALDAFGARESLLLALPALIEWSRNPVGSCPALPETEPLSPRRRYALRVWEEQYLGAPFTSAPEMENLRKLLDGAGDLRSRLISTTQVGPSLIGQSICLVGLFHDIRLVPNPRAVEKEGAPAGVEHIATAMVEDLDGEIEMVAFPPNYKRHEQLWTENNPVIITARVSAGRGKADESVYLLCEHLAPFGTGAEEEIFTVKVRPSKRGETVPLPPPEAKASDGGAARPPVSTTDAVPTAPVAPSSYPKKQDTAPALESVTSTSTAVEDPGYHLVITLPISDDDHADIDRMIHLNRILRSRPGPDTVTLRIPYSPETGAVTTAQLPKGVSYSSRLEEEISALLGPDALALIRLGG